MSAVGAQGAHVAPPQTRTSNQPSRSRFPGAAHHRPAPPSTGGLPARGSPGASSRVKAGLSVTTRSALTIFVVASTSMIWSSARVSLVAWCPGPIGANSQTAEEIVKVQVIESQQSPSTWIPKLHSSVVDKSLRQQEDGEIFFGQTIPTRNPSFAQ